ncbi:MAG: glucosaminidase domain-containing protein, partial [Mariprofundaceae bacterium]|nr:glucosaminidase domain-containing protein [Mariprofundaceae bacterium]
MNLKKLYGVAWQLTCRSVFLLAALSLAACNMEVNSAQIEAQYPIVGSITNLPDFAAIKDIKSKKKAFFDFLRPIVISENAKVAKSRLRMLDIATRLDHNDTISPDDAKWLAWLADKYHIDMPSPDDEQAWMLLTRRVDTVPFRLALAQAANESSWGTSRFAREGRNLFGEWCFKKDCGMVP